MSATHRNAGFTLVEMMVALALLALLAAVLYGGLSQGTRSWAAVERTSDETAEVLHTQTLLREMLGHVGEIWPSDDRIVFAGNARGLVLDAVWQSHLPTASTHRIAFERDGDALVMRWRGLGGGGEDARILLDGVASAEWRYFGATEADTDLRWHSDWPAREQLPRLVELRLEFADPRRIWPRFLAEIP